LNVGWSREIEEVRKEGELQVRTPPAMGHGIIAFPSPSGVISRGLGVKFMFKFKLCYTGPSVSTAALITT
jgi:hypothetical protein